MLINFVGITNKMEKTFSLKEKKIITKCEEINLYDVKFLFLWATSFVA